MSRAVDRDARKALLDRIAAKRAQQGLQQRGAVVDLEDSSSDEESFATARSRGPAVLGDSSEEIDSEEENQQPKWAPAAGGRGRLNRLRKAGEAAAPPQPAPGSSDEDGSSDDDDIAAQLGGLSIRAKPGGGGSSRPAAPPPKARPNLSGVLHARPAAGTEQQAEQDSKCLVLGESGEFKLNAKTSTMLYPHQVEGVKWLWSLFRLGRGGILADDMGLGKTIQCAAFLAGLIDSRLIRRAIVVAPKTLLAQWQKELGVCGLAAATHEYGGTANEREYALERVVRRRGVLLTTYGMVLHNAEVLAEHDAHDPDDGPLWDIMICDEGHKLKNPRMQLRKQLDAVPVALRVVISGTPIQNNLLEMWALFNFCAPDVLGDAADFKSQYEKAITNGSDKHATQYERERGAVAAARLRQEIGPYMLRREKREVFKSADSQEQGDAEATSGTAAEAAAAGGAGKEGGAKPSSMPHKNDLIVWLKLKPMQRKVYQAFLNSDSVKSALNQTSSALAAITVLKKVCDHPALLSERAAHGIVSGASRARRKAAAYLGGEAGSGSEDEVDEIEDSEEGEWESDSEDYSSDDGRQRSRQRRAKQHNAQAAARSRAAPAAAEEDWSEWASADLEQQLLDEIHTTGFAASCKTVFVMRLLKNLVAEGHRTLIFSQSRVMLNILEAAIKEEGWRFCRIDGSVASAAEREARVRKFQTAPAPGIPIFLLTSQVGGLGLTLTAADRVVILDPAWNPSTDNQSVDRAYRIGQKRDVVVYRLISCGTVEEKIYRRQVFKGGLSRTGMEEGEQFRYFAQEDLRDLFRLEPSECESSRTQRELHDMHAHQRRETAELRTHLAFLRSLDCYAGVSDHDLLFSKKEREAPPVPAGRPQPGALGRPPASSSSAGGGGFAAGGARRTGASAGSSPRKGVFSKTASQGWSGGSELSDLFAKAVTISGGSRCSGAAAAAIAATAQPPGSGWTAGGSGAAGPVGQPMPAPPAGLPRPRKDPLQERIEQLEETLERKRHLLTLAAGLADGGARVRSQIAEAEAELAAVKRQLSSSSGVHVSAPGSAAVPPNQPGALPAAPPDGGAASPASSSHIGASSSRLTTAAASLLSAAAMPLPSTDGGRQQGGARPAAPAHLPAAPKLAVPESRPAGSPFLSRMRDMFWGSGKKQQAPAVEPPAGAGGGGRTLSCEGPPAQRSAPSSSSMGSVIDLSGDTPDRPGAAPAVVPARSDNSTISSSSVGAPSAPAAVPASHAVQQAAHQQATADGKPQRPLREIKGRLMETLLAIKEMESGGYFERTKVEKLRRRAARLNREYEEAKQAQGGEAAAALKGPVAWLAAIDGQPPEAG